MKTKTCERCAATFQPNSGVQRYCLPCRPVARRDSGKAYRRDVLGIVPVGVTLACAECSADFIFRGGTQTRCEPCQAAISKGRQSAIAKAHPRRAHYRKKARMQALYGGNREASLERDGNACRKCGATESLHTHHIDGRGKGYPVKDRNNAIGNLITLCNGCHIGLHALTARVLFERHPDDVKAILAEFLA